MQHFTHSTNWIQSTCLGLSFSQENRQNRPTWMTQLCTSTGSKCGWSFPLKKCVSHLQLLQPPAEGRPTATASQHGCNGLGSPSFLLLVLAASGFLLPAAVTVEDLWGLNVGQGVLLATSAQPPPPPPSIGWKRVGVVSIATLLILTFLSLGIMPVSI